jgi:hypothetical protein
MIRYQLCCSRGHGFEGWFRSSDAFAEEVRELVCPVCSDPSIEKAIMAPAVLQRDHARLDASSMAEPGEAAQTAPPQDLPAASPPSATVTTMPAPPQGMDQAQLAKALVLMRKLRAHVEANFENVGPRFAEEARKIHLEETEPRGIYGQASREEVRSLEEDGIAVMPLPGLPKLDG